MPETQILEPPAPSETERKIPYTILTKRQKQFLTFVVCLTSVSSTLTATAYFPLLPLLSKHFHVSVQAINLTITLYIIFQAISPFLFATLSDTLGRRPIYLLTFTLYTLASLGLALNKDSYAGLLVLRALQSLGASAIAALVYGIVADVCVPAERGRMLGWVLAAGNVGPNIGPVMGGWIAMGSGGFRWVFWLFAIYGGLSVLILGFFLIETARNVVGNGSVRPHGWWRTWWSLLTEWVSENKVGEETVKAAQDAEETAAVEDSRTGRGNWRFTNPLACLRILF
jgi:MFS family permease